MEAFDIAKGFEFAMGQLLAWTAGGLIGCVIILIPLGIWCAWIWCKGGKKR